MDENSTSNEHLSLEIVGGGEREREHERSGNRNTEEEEEGEEYINDERKRVLVDDLLGDADMLRAPPILFEWPDDSAGSKKNGGSKNDTCKGRGASSGGVLSRSRPNSSSTPPSSKDRCEVARRTFFIEDHVRRRAMEATIGRRSHWVAVAKKRLQQQQTAEEGYVRGKLMRVYRCPPPRPSLTTTASHDNNKETEGNRKRDEEEEESYSPLMRMKENDLLKNTSSSLHRRQLAADSAGAEFLDTISLAVVRETTQLRSGDGNDPKQRRASVGVEGSGKEVTTTLNASPQLHSLLKSPTDASPTSLSDASPTLLSFSHAPPPKRTRKVLFTEDLLRETSSHQDVSAAGEGEKEEENEQDGGNGLTSVPIVLPPRPSTPPPPRDIHMTHQSLLNFASLGRPKKWSEEKYTKALKTLRDVVEAQFTLFYGNRVETSNVVGCVHQFSDALLLGIRKESGGQLNDLTIDRKGGAVHNKNVNDDKKENDVNTVRETTRRVDTNEKMTTTTDVGGAFRRMEAKAELLSTLFPYEHSSYDKAKGARGLSGGRQEQTTPNLSSPIRFRWQQQGREREGSSPLSRSTEAKSLSSSFADESKSPSKKKSFLPLLDSSQRRSAFLESLLLSLSPSSIVDINYKNASSEEVEKAAREEKKEEKVCRESEIKSTKKRRKGSSPSPLLATSQGSTAAISADAEKPSAASAVGHDVRAFVSGISLLLSQPHASKNAEQDTTVTVIETEDPNSHSPSSSSSTFNKLVCLVAEAQREMEHRELEKRLLSVNKGRGNESSSSSIAAKSSKGPVPHPISTDKIVNEDTVEGLMDAIIDHFNAEVLEAARAKERALNNEEEESGEDEEGDGNDINDDDDGTNEKKEKQKGIPPPHEKSKKKDEGMKKATRIVHEPSEVAYRSSKKANKGKESGEIPPRPQGRRAVKDSTTKEGTPKKSTPNSQAEEGLDDDQNEECEGVFPELDSEIDDYGSSSSSDNNLTDKHMYRGEDEHAVIRTKREPSINVNKKNAQEPKKSLFVAKTSGAFATATVTANQPQEAKSKGTTAASSASSKSPSPKNEQLSATTATNTATIKTERRTEKEFLRLVSSAGLSVEEASLLNKRFRLVRRMAKGEALCGNDEKEAVKRVLTLRRGDDSAAYGSPRSLHSQPKAIREWMTNGQSHPLSSPSPVWPPSPTANTNTNTKTKAQGGKEGSNDAENDEEKPKGNGHNHQNNEAVRIANYYNSLGSVATLICPDGDWASDSASRGRRVNGRRPSLALPVAHFDDSFVFDERDAMAVENYPFDKSADDVAHTKRLSTSKGEMTMERSQSILKRSESILNKRIGNEHTIAIAREVAQNDLHDHGTTQDSSASSPSPFSFSAPRLSPTLLLQHAATKDPNFSRYHAAVASSAPASWLARAYDPTGLLPFKTSRGGDADEAEEAVVLSVEAGSMRFAPTNDFTTANNSVKAQKLNLAREGGSLQAKGVLSSEHVVPTQPSKQFADAIQWLDEASSITDALLRHCKSTETNTTRHSEVSPLSSAASVEGKAKERASSGVLQRRRAAVLLKHKLFSSLIPSHGFFLSPTTTTDAAAPNAEGEALGKEKGKRIEEATAKRKSGVGVLHVGVGMQGKAMRVERDRDMETLGLLVHWLDVQTHPTQQRSETKRERKEIKPNLPQNRNASTKGLLLEASDFCHVFIEARDEAAEGLVKRCGGERAALENMAADESRREHGPHSSASARKEIDEQPSDPFGSISNKKTNLNPQRESSAVASSVYSSVSPPSSPTGRGSKSFVVGGGSSLGASIRSSSAIDALGATRTYTSMERITMLESENSVESRRDLDFPASSKSGHSGGRGSGLLASLRQYESEGEEDEDDRSDRTKKERSGSKKNQNVENKIVATATSSSDKNLSVDELCETLHQKEESGGKGTDTMPRKKKDAPDRISVKDFFSIRDAEGNLVDPDPIGVRPIKVLPTVSAVNEMLSSHEEAREALRISNKMKREDERIKRRAERRKNQLSSSSMNGAPSCRKEKEKLDGGLVSPQSPPPIGRHPTLRRQFPRSLLVLAEEREAFLAKGKEEAESKNNNGEDRPSKSETVQQHQKGSVSSSQSRSSNRRVLSSSSASNSEDSSSSICGDDSDDNANKKDTGKHRQQHDSIFFFDCKSDGEEEVLLVAQQPVPVLEHGVHYIMKRGGAKERDCGAESSPEADAFYSDLGMDDFDPEEPIERIVFTDFVDEFDEAVKRLRDATDRVAAAEAQRVAEKARAEADRWAQLLAQFIKQLTGAEEKARVEVEREEKSARFGPLEAAYSDTVRSIRAQREKEEAFKALYDLSRMECDVRRTLRGQEDEAFAALVGLEVKERARTIASIRHIITFPPFELVADMPSWDEQFKKYNAEKMSSGNKNTFESTFVYVPSVSFVQKRPFRVVFDGPSQIVSSRVSLFDGLEAYTNINHNEDLQTPTTRTERNEGCFPTESAEPRPDTVFLHSLVCSGMLPNVDPAHRTREGDGYDLFVASSSFSSGEDDDDSITRENANEAVEGTKRGGGGATAADSSLIPPSSVPTSTLSAPQNNKKKTQSKKEGSIVGGGAALGDGATGRAMSLMMRMEEEQYRMSIKDERRRSKGQRRRSTRASGVSTISFQSSHQEDVGGLELMRKKRNTIVKSVAESYDDQAEESGAGDGTRGRRPSSSCSFASTASSSSTLLHHPHNKKREKQRRKEQLSLILDEEVFLADDEAVGLVLAAPTPPPTPRTTQANKGEGEREMEGESPLFYDEDVFPTIRLLVPRKTNKSVNQEGGEEEGGEEARSSDNNIIIPDRFEAPPLHPLTLLLEAELAKRNKRDLAERRRLKREKILEELISGKNKQQTQKVRRENGPSISSDRATDQHGNGEESDGRPNQDGSAKKKQSAAFRDESAIGRGARISFASVGVESNQMQEKQKGDYPYDGDDGEEPLGDDFLDGDLIDPECTLSPIRTERKENERQSENMYDDDEGGVGGGKEREESRRQRKRTSTSQSNTPSSVSRTESGAKTPSATTNTPSLRHNNIATTSEQEEGAKLGAQNRGPVVTISQSIIDRDSAKEKERERREAELEALGGLLRSPEMAEKMKRKESMAARKARLAQEKLNAERLAADAAQMALRDEEEKELMEEAERIRQEEEEAAARAHSNFGGGEAFFETARVTAEEIAERERRAKLEALQKRQADRRAKKALFGEGAGGRVGSGGSAVDAKGVRSGSASYSESMRDLNQYEHGHTSPPPSRSNNNNNRARAGAMAADSEGRIIPLAHLSSGGRLGSANPAAAGAMVTLVRPAEIPSNTNATTTASAHNTNIKLANDKEAFEMKKKRREERLRQLQQEKREAEERERERQHVQEYDDILSALQVISGGLYNDDESDDVNDIDSNEGNRGDSEAGSIPDEDNDAEETKEFKYQRGFADFEAEEKQPSERNKSNPKRGGAGGTLKSRKARDRTHSMELAIKQHYEQITAEAIAESFPSRQHMLHQWRFRPFGATVVTLMKPTRQILRKLIDIGGIRMDEGGENEKKSKGEERRKNSGNTEKKLSVVNSSETVGENESAAKRSSSSSFNGNNKKKQSVNVWWHVTEEARGAVESADREEIDRLVPAPSFTVAQIISNTRGERGSGLESVERRGTLISYSRLVPSLWARGSNTSHSVDQNQNQTENEAQSGAYPHIHSRSATSAPSFSFDAGALSKALQLVTERNKNNKNSRVSLAAVNEDPGVLAIIGTSTAAVSFSTDGEHTRRRRSTPASFYSLISTYAQRARGHNKELGPLSQRIVEPNPDAIFASSSSPSPLRVPTRNESERKAPPSTDTTNNSNKQQKRGRPLPPSTIPYTEETVLRDAPFFPHFLPRARPVTTNSAASTSAAVRLHEALKKERRVREEFLETGTPDGDDDKQKILKEIHGDDNSDEENADPSRKLMSEERRRKALANSAATGEGVPSSHLTPMEVIGEERRGPREAVNKGTLHGRDDLTRTMGLTPTPGRAQSQASRRQYIGKAANALLPPISPSMVAAGVKKHRTEEERLRAEAMETLEAKRYALTSSSSSSSPSSRLNSTAMKGHLGRASGYPLPSLLNINNNNISNTLINTTPPPSSSSDRGGAGFGGRLAAIGALGNASSRTPSRQKVGGGRGGGSAATPLMVSRTTSRAVTPSGQSLMMGDAIGSIAPTASDTNNNDNDDGSSVLSSMNLIGGYSFGRVTPATGFRVRSIPSDIATSPLPLRAASKHKVMSSSSVGAKTHARSAYSAAAGRPPRAVSATPPSSSGSRSPQPTAAHEGTPKVEKSVDGGEPPARHATRAALQSAISSSTYLAPTQFALRHSIDRVADVQRDLLKLLEGLKWDMMR